MKKYTKIVIAWVSFFGVTVFHSCQKNDIEVLNNTDTSWEVNKEISEADIRTRIGYDPRFSYAYFKQSNVDIKMITFGDVKVTKTHKKEIEISLTQEAKKEVQIGLEYDAAFYQTIKDNHIGYELGEQSLVTIDQAVKTIPAGQKSVTFTLSSENVLLDRKVILPYTIKIVQGEDVIRLFEKDKSLLLKIEQPEEVQVTISPTAISKNAKWFAASNQTELTDKKIEFTIKASQLLSDDIYFGLVRNEAYTPTNGFTLAPDAMEDSSVKVRLNTETTSKIAFDLNNVSSLGVGKYVLPLKLVVYDANNQVHNLEGKEVLVSINVIDTTLFTIPDNGNNVQSYNSETGITLGTKISNKSNWRLEFQGTAYDKTSMIDGNLITLGYFSDSAAMTFKLGEVRKVKSVVFAAEDMKYAMTGLTCYATNTTTGETKILQGTVTFASKTKKCVIQFTEPVLVDELYFDNFSGVSNWIDLNELDVYVE